MDVGIQTRLARNVRAVREDSGLSKSAFALRLGISRPQLDLKLLNLEKIADRLGVEASELIR